MPYKVKRSGKGYKVFKKDTTKSYSKKPLPKKKAEAQMRALYANESLIPEEEMKHNTLEYFKLWKYPKLNQYHVWFKLNGEDGVLFTLVYTAGETMEDVDYVETQVTDGSIPNIEIFEDPQSDEAKKILSRYKLTGDDIENAGQEGYEAIGRYVPALHATQESIKEDLQFEKYAVSILKSEKES